MNYIDINYEHETQRVCSINRPISHVVNDLILTNKTICFVTTSNTLKYCKQYNTVVFQSFLFITVLLL